MNTKTTASDHLLDASLEWLHSQTLVWMKDVDFWKEEGKFFYNLLRKKEVRPVFPEREIAVLEKEIVRIMADDLEPLKSTLLAHERLLKSCLKKGIATDEKQYRDAHHEIVHTVNLTDSKIRDFKQRIFKFLKSAVV